MYILSKYELDQDRVELGVFDSLEKISDFVNENFVLEDEYHLDDYGCFDLNDSIFLKVEDCYRF